MNKWQPREPKDKSGEHPTRGGRKKQEGEAMLPPVVLGISMHDFIILILISGLIGVFFRFHMGSGRKSSAVAMAELTAFAEEFATIIETQLNG